MMDDPSKCGNSKDVLEKINLVSWTDGVHSTACRFPRI